MNKKAQRNTAFATGVIFVVALVVLAIAFPHPTPFQYVVFRIILALAAAGFAAMIPGFIELTIGKWLRAGGALAVFAIVYFYNPAKLVVSESTRESFPVSQVMVASPGGVQVGGDLNISPDKRLIQSILLRITIDRSTTATPPTGRETDVGRQSAVALFTANKTRIRFVSDWMVTNQQVSSNMHRISFSYAPEIPNEILGRNLEFLKEIDNLVVNYSPFYGSSEPAVVTYSLVVNGIEVASDSANAGADVLKGGQAVLQVAEAFRQSPEHYEAKVAQIKIR